MFFMPDKVFVESAETCSFQEYDRVVQEIPFHSNTVRLPDARAVKEQRKRFIQIVFF